MFKNLSMKKKAVLFIIVTILAIILVILPTYMDNKKNKVILNSVWIDFTQCLLK